jgi:hypothetical protein
VRRGGGGAVERRRRARGDRAWRRGMGRFTRGKWGEVRGEGAARGEGAEVDEQR